MTGTTRLTYWVGGWIVLAIAAPCISQPAVRSTADLDFFVGSWEGESTFVPAFTPNAQPRREQIRTECGYVLARNYIQCNWALTNAAGRERGVMILWNHNATSGDYEALVLASNHGQESSYAIRWDPDLNAYVGHLRTRTAEGRPAMERLVWRVEADRSAIRGQELIRPDGAEDSGWVQTFDFIWRRTGAGGGPR